jgi:ankyrin repeat protein
MIYFRLGAEIDCQNPINKFTPLHYAVTGSNREAIQILLDSGAKTDIRNSDVYVFFLFVLI